MSENNKQLVRRLVEEGFNKGNLSVYDELLADDYVYHEPTIGEKHGRQGSRELVTMYRNAFPDARLTINEQIAEGNTVVTRWTAHGTHRGELMGIPPTGHQVTVEGVIVTHFRNNKIVEEFETYDALGMFRQLGAAPAIKAAA